VLSIAYAAIVPARAGSSNTTVCCEKPLIG
jgi:hypothetical protein